MGASMNMDLQSARAAILCTPQVLQTDVVYATSENFFHFILLPKFNKDAADTRTLTGEDTASTGVLQPSSS